MSEKRRKLEQAATEAVQKIGLTNLSFRALADEVGIKSASVHYYFPGKSDLAATLIEGYSEKFSALLSESSSESSSLQSTMTAFMSIFEQVLADGKFCLCGMMAAEVESLDSNSRALLQSYFEVSEAWLTKLMDSHRDELSTSLPSQTLARVIMSGMEGAILLDRVGGGKKRLDAQKELIHSLLL
ncbi:TetR/AcrR family transcriptional regulator [Arenicella sp. 4NH20-0111]|uniref:TetR/AcrR family transcriptional regulator n=1 Tax=Arenicella sp. 4NH20-0111 TaxID=3127648 RepID=UPI003101F7B8